MSQEKDDKHIEPTQTAYDTPYNTPYDNVYESNPYEPTMLVDEYGKKLIAPPPPPQSKQRHSIRHTLRLALLITALLLIVASSTYVVTILARTGQNTTTAHQIKSTHSIKAPMSSPSIHTTVTIAVTPTVFPTATSTSQAIPSSTLTANGLYQDFVNAHIGVTSPTDISSSWWQSMGESYYPARGGVQFTDINSNASLQIAVFNAAQAATTDAQEATSSPNGWAAQYVQVNTCVLFSTEGPIDIQYYKPTMQSYCI